MRLWPKKALGLWGFGGSYCGRGAEGTEDSRADAGEAVAVRCGARRFAGSPWLAIATIVPLVTVCLCRPWLDQLTRRTLMFNGTHGECAR